VVVKEVVVGSLLFLGGLRKFGNALTWKWREFLHGFRGASVEILRRKYAHQDDNVLAPTHVPEPTPTSVEMKSHGT
jgi:hypothetical protein